MSAPISPSLPRSPEISGDRKDELFAFDGGDALWQSWRDGLTPDASLQVSEWADRHRFLSPRASAEPGRYRTSRTPYMRAIMDALSPSNPCRRIVFMKAAQVGATEAHLSATLASIDTFIARNAAFVSRRNVSSNNVSLRFRALTLHACVQ